MTDSFVEDVQRLHDAGSRFIAAPCQDEIVEMFSEKSFREHITLAYGRRGTHGGPTELYEHQDLAGTALRHITPSKVRFASVDSLRPDDLVGSLAELVRPVPSMPCAISAAPPSRDRHDHSRHDFTCAIDLPKDAPDAVTLDEKRHLLQAAADAALSLEPSLTELDVSFQGVVRRFFVAATDIQPVVAATAHVGIRVFAASRRASAYAVGGAPGGIGHFLEESPESIARACIERLHALEGARDARMIRGELPVVIEGGWGGVWLHEAVGHLLEADTHSPHSPEAIGRRIGSDHVTVIDDGSRVDGRGSCPFDDEGMPTRASVLIERGILRRLITDRQSARRTGLPRSGNGRRQDYRHAPLPRMTNLMLANGTTPVEDLLQDLPLGLYIRLIGSGEVRPKDDHFRFSVLEGRMIEDGALTAPVTSLEISGRASSMLKRIVGVGDDFRIDPARGTCMKAGQTVPVSVGMPTVLLDKVAVAPAS